MQTFLPFLLVWDDSKSVLENLQACFRLTAQLLDNKRTGKQRVEAMQLLNILLDRNPDSSWKRHPVLQMWKPWVEALKLYYNCFLEEWMARGFVNNLPLETIDEAVLEAQGVPPFLTNRHFVQRHQANLLTKHRDFYLRYDWGVEPREGYYWYLDGAYVLTKYGRRYASDLSGDDAPPEPEAPPKKARRSAKRKSADAAVKEEEEEEGEDGDERKAKRRRAPVRKVVAKRKAKKEDDEEEEEGEEDRVSTTQRRKKKVVVKKEEDDDDDFVAPPSRRLAKSSRSRAAAKRAQVIKQEEGEEEADEEKELEDEEEEEPLSKKKKAKRTAKNTTTTKEEAKEDNDVGTLVSSFAFARTSGRPRRTRAGRLALR